MKRSIPQRVLCVLLLLAIMVGLLPAISLPASATTGTPGESTANPILISTMDQLIEEMEKDVETPTYYKLTRDLSHETAVKHSITLGDYSSEREGYDTVRKSRYAQCLVGTGKKFLELDGHNVKYKNNVNLDLKPTSTNGYDSLTFFYLGEGCDLTVSNTSMNLGRLWYDAWMNKTTNFAGGPNYCVTVVRDVFRVDTGAELVLNNVDVKAGRDGKKWIANGLNVDKDDESLLDMVFNGNSYEVIYGSAVVVTGGKVTINGGFFSGQGGIRNAYNVYGVQSEADAEYIENNFSGGAIAKDNMVKNCLTNRGAKAAVQIAGEDSTVIINGGEFWGSNGANVIGINTLDGNSVKKYTLRINAGTFDTSKQSKERLPDRTAGTSCIDPWPFSWGNMDLWANCRCVRNGRRGYIGIPAVDGYGENVFNTSMVHVYIDDEDPDAECFENSELDFSRKSDSDTIIVKPREQEDYDFTQTHTWENDRGNHHNEIYVYSGDQEITELLDFGSFYSNGFYYEPSITQTLYYSAESHYDLTDTDNPYFNRAHDEYCDWTMFAYDKNGNQIESITRRTKCSYYEHKDGHTIFNFKIDVNMFKEVPLDKSYRYSIIAVMNEVFADRYTTYQTQQLPRGVLDHNSPDYGKRMVYDPDYCGSFASSGAEVIYSDAAYGLDPVLTFNDAYNDKLKGSKSFQWQMQEGVEWVDYGSQYNNVDAAIDSLCQHNGLANKILRIKITSSDGTYPDALYSNACFVQPDINTAIPGGENFIWEEDPNNSGKYILKSDKNYGTIEYLLFRKEESTDRDTLDWTNAVDTPYFDNLEMGYYKVVRRFKATENYTAGSEILVRKVAVGPYTLTEDFEVTYNGEPVDTIIVEVGKEFCLHSSPLPADATNSDIVNQTAWSPVGDIGDLISARWLEYYPFNKDNAGRNLWLKATQTGTVQIMAIVTLDDGSHAFQTVTIHIVPEGYVPYTASVLNSGISVPVGGTFTPLTRLHSRRDALLDSSSDPGVNIKKLKEQAANAELVWTLLPDLELNRPVTMLDEVTATNGKATINCLTGKITLTSSAKPGDVIRFVGLHKDPYIGLVNVPGYFNVVADSNTHTHDYASYAQHDDAEHYLCCECGDKITQEHTVASCIIQEATETSDAIYYYYCSCGFGYEASLEGSKLVHEHSLIYAYDLQKHWQVCGGEGCTDEDYATEPQAHDFTLLGTTDDGKEVFACSVCGAMKQDDSLCVGITAQPQSVAAFRGEKATVTVQAAGEGLTYTWYFKNKGDSSFSKTDTFKGNTYSVEMNASRNGRQVYCVITDVYGNIVQSDTVTLSMAVEITTQPKTTYTRQGATAKVSFTAEGDGLTYQWYIKNADSTKYSKSSITSATYSVKMTDKVKDRLVYCVVTDQYGNSIKTETVRLRMAATITEQPADTCAADGEKLTVKLTAVGDGLTYQWYFKDAGATKFSLTSSFTGPSYSVVMNDARNGRQIYCVVTDKYGKSHTSDVVTIGKPLEIITAPKTTYAQYGKTAKVTVKAEGVGLTYEWYIKNVGEIRYTKSSITGSTYSCKMDEARNGRYLICYVSDQFGNRVKCDTVRLRLVASITVQPESVTVAKGEQAKVTLTAVGDGLTYTWYFKDAGATSFTKTTAFTGNAYSVTMTEARDGRQIYCVVTDKYGKTAKTDTVTLRMK